MLLIGEQFNFVVKNRALPSNDHRKGRKFPHRPRAFPLVSTIENLFSMSYARNLGGMQKERRLLLGYIKNFCFLEEQKFI